jgi:hypothetical protein
MIFDGGVPATDHRDLLATEEEPVTRGARRQAVAEQAHLRVEPEHQRLRSGRHDDGVRTVLDIADVHPVRPLAHVDASHLLRQELGAEPGGLRAEARHQLRTGDAVGETREVLDVGRQHELAARLIARRRRLALDDQR